MTVLEIWNGALSLLPHDRRIKDINEDSTEALRCRDAWDRVRKQLIAKHEWGWLVCSTPCINGAKCDDSEATYRYPYPSAVRVLGLFDASGRRVKAEVVNHAIVSPEPKGYIRYLPDEDNANRYPPWFADALVSLLAETLMPMFHNASNNSRLQVLSQKLISEAIRIDSSEVQWSGTDGKTFAKARV